MKEHVNMMTHQGVAAANVGMSMLQPCQVVDAQAHLVYSCHPTFVLCPLRAGWEVCLITHRWEKKIATRWTVSVPGHNLLNVD